MATQTFSLALETDDEILAPRMRSVIAIVDCFHSDGFRKGGDAAEAFTIVGEEDVNDAVIETLSDDAAYTYTLP